MAEARGRQAAAMAAVALAAAGCGLTGAVSGRGGHAGTRPAAVRPPVSAQLTSFASCDEMLSQLRAQALAEVGPDGLAGIGVPLRDAAPLAATTLPAMAAAAPSAAGASAGTDATGQAAPAFSSTNDQEQGVDEPDIAKTDGRLLVTLRSQAHSLQVVDVSGTPRLRGSLPLDQQLSTTGLFLVGADAVVLGDTYATTPSTEVVVVSLSDPDRPVVSRSFTVQGHELDARLIAGHIEVVVQSSPRLPFVTPGEPTPAAAAQALATNKAVIMQSTPADWLPTVTSQPSGTTTTAPCTKAMQAGSPDGLDTVSVVPIDPSADQAGPAVTVVGDGSTVYAGATSLFVASPVWPTTQSGPVALPVDPPVPLGGVSIGGLGGGGTVGSGTVGGGGTGAPAIAGPSTPPVTNVFGFDLSDPGTPRYIGSGQVPGTLIGQYAMSAYQGYLRVATTVGAATPPPGEGVAPERASDNRVTVLQPSNGALVTVASLGGLGGGEKIYAVRFEGPLGYVVTFRQTDPLFVVDLRDPLHPQLQGQVALDGYSSFLEPLSGNLLLGVGQSVDANLRTQGLQVSLFDVSDPANPTLVGKDVLASASSLAGSDPHALLYWAPTDTVVLPVQQYVGAAGSASAPFDGAIAFGVSGRALREAGRLSQPATEPAPVPVPMPDCTNCAFSTPAMVASAGIERALVVGSMLYTVSEAGIMASDLTTYAEQAWLAYPG